MSQAARRALHEAIVSSVDNRAELARIPGERLAGLKYGTRFNQGYAGCSFSLLGRDGSESIPDDEAWELSERWFGARIRITADGETAWEGRVADLDPHSPTDDLSAGRLSRFDVVAEGLYALLQDDSEAQPVYEPNNEDDDPSASATTVLMDAIISTGGVLDPDWTHVSETAILAPVSRDDQKYWYDHLVDALKAGSSDGVEYWFGVFGRTPYLKPITVATYPDARLSVVGTGLHFPKRLSELVTGGRARYSDDTQQQTTELIDDPTGSAVRRANGLTRRRTITLDRVGESGALSGLRTFLSVHANPRGPMGDGEGGQISLAAMAGDLWPDLRGAGGQQLPPWQLRCGHTVELYDLHPGVTGLERRFIVSETEVDVDGGSLALAFDRRPIRSRRHERSAEIALQRSLTEPGAAGAVVLNAQSWAAYNSVSVPIQLNTIGADGAITFTVPSTRKYIIEIHGYYTTGAASGRVSIGYALNGEGWDDDQDDRTAVIRQDSATATFRSLHRTFRPRRITAGRLHTIEMYGRADSGSTDLLDYGVIVRRP